MPKRTRQSCLNFCLFAFFVITSTLFSCVSSKKVVYVNNTKNDTLYPGPIVMKDVTPFIDPRIESNDVLAITIQTMTQTEGTNTPITSNSAGSFNEMNGFLVDKDGYIELPLVGFAKVGGLTTAEARELLKQKAKEFYRNPVVNVRIANFDITVQGDVGKPGKVNIPSEKATIFDVFALSGDINLSGKKKNILLIRSEGDKRTFVRLDVTSSEIYRSPYLYVKQRDFLYVEPNRSKIAASDSRLIRSLGIISSLVSLASLFLVFRIIK
ncbi:MAG: polysaccharide biosynthesis/export family protein [Bacteroidota bacterium]